MARHDPEELLALGARLAAGAAALLRAGLAGGRAPVATKTSATDLVTALDRASERFVVEGLVAARPADAILGEEGTERAGTSGVRWILDPLDGTTNYTYGVPAFAVSLAAEVDGVVEAAVVAEAFHGETFTAIRGAGARLGDRALECNEQADLGLALVGTGFSYDSERRRRQAAVLVDVLPAVRDVRRGGAASLDLCWVACGRLDAFYERGLQPWDLAAGALVAAEAGAVVGDLDGGPPSGGFVLAAGPGLYAPLADLLVRAGARGA